MVENLLQSQAIEELRRIARLLAGVAIVDSLQGLQQLSSEALRLVGEAQALSGIPPDFQTAETADAYRALINLAFAEVMQRY